MSEIQIPSTRLKQFFNDPRGGETIKEASDFVQPSIDVLEFLYPRNNDEINFITEAGDIQQKNIAGGAGVYRVNITFCGFIQSNLAGEHSLSITYPGIDSDTFTYLNVSLAAAEIYNIAPVVVQTILVIGGDTPEVSWGWEYANSSAPTKVEIRAHYDIIRIA